MELKVGKQKDTKKDDAAAPAQLDGAESTSTEQANTEQSSTEGAELTLKLESTLQPQKDGLNTALAKEEKKVEQPKRNAADYIPCNWHIVATKKGITAVNNVTGREFTGTHAEFKEFMRG